MGQVHSIETVDEDLAERGLNNTRLITPWAPLWGLLGIGLPITFLGEVRPVSMYLTAHDLVPLYATEWLILAPLGLLISLTCFLVSMLAGGCQDERRRSSIYAAAFAMTLALGTVIAIEMWVSSLGHSSRSQSSWHIAACFAVIIVGAGAGRGLFKQGLSRLATLACALSLVGASTLVPLNFYHAVSRVVTDSNLAVNPSRPNIVLISVDALSAGHLTTYGSTRLTDPNIAQFAAKSIVFERFHANGNFTTPGVASILTGVMPWKHRAFQLLGTPLEPYIEKSLPALLHSSGYETAYFPTNPWAGARRQGFSKYFDHYESNSEWDAAPCFDNVADRLPYLCAASSNPLVNSPFKLVVHVLDAGGILDANGSSAPERTFRAADRWIKQRRKSPVFMWVHFMPPHDPYAAPVPWLNKFDASDIATTDNTSHPRYLFESSFDTPARVKVLEARYDESISYVDHSVGALIDSVQKNLGANTAILLTGDHGESFSHEYGGHGGVMLYEELIHIPMILMLPEGRLGGERRPELASQADIAPTLAALANLPPSSDWEGASLIDKSPFLDNRTIFSMDFEQNRSRDAIDTGSIAAIRGVWKLVRFIGNSVYPYMPRLDNQLFNIAADPLEQENLAAKLPDVVASLSREIDQKLQDDGHRVDQ